MGCLLWIFSSFKVMTPQSVLLLGKSHAHCDKLVRAPTGHGTRCLCLLYLSTRMLVRSLSQSCWPTQVEDAWNKIRGGGCVQFWLCCFLGLGTSGTFWNLNSSVGVSLKLWVINPCCALQSWHWVWTSPFTSYTSIQTSVFYVLWIVTAHLPNRTQCRTGDLTSLPQKICCDGKQSFMAVLWLLFPVCLALWYLLGKARGLLIFIDTVSYLYPCILCIHQFSNCTWKNIYIYSKFQKVLWSKTWICWTPTTVYTNLCCIYNCLHSIYIMLRYYIHLEMN